MTRSKIRFIFLLMAWIFILIACSDVKVKDFEAFSKTVKELETVLKVGGENRKVVEKLVANLKENIPDYSKRSGQNESVATLHGVANKVIQAYEELFKPIKEIKSAENALKNQQVELANLYTEKVKEIKLKRVEEALKSAQMFLRIYSEAREEGK